MELLRDMNCTESSGIGETWPAGITKQSVGRIRALINTGSIPLHRDVLVFRSDSSIQQPNIQTITASVHPDRLSNLARAGQDREMYIEPKTKEDLAYSIFSRPTCSDNRCHASGTTVSYGV